MTDSKEDWPKVAIIVLNWNDWRDTIECHERVIFRKYNILLRSKCRMRSGRWKKLDRTRSI